MEDLYDVLQVRVELLQRAPQERKQLTQVGNLVALPHYRGRALLQHSRIVHIDPQLRVITPHHMKLIVVGSCKGRQHLTHR